jgi:hypothetical protein
VGPTCQWLDGGATYRFGRGLLAGWAGFGAWAETTPSALFSFFLFELFSFFVLKIDKVLFANKIA